MKINEVIVEGFWDSLAKGMGAHEVAQAIQANRAANAAGKAAQTTTVQQPDQTTAAQQQKVPAQVQHLGFEVKPGYRLVVTDPKTNGHYYKTPEGWFNGYDQKIVIPKSTQYLENLADQGQGKMLPYRPKLAQPKLTRPTQRKRGR